MSNESNLNQKTVCFADRYWDKLFENAKKRVDYDKNYINFIVEKK